MTAWRCHRNQLLRPKVNEVLDNVKKGQRIMVSPIATSLTTRRQSVEPKTISNMLKEREDFIPRGKGVWERISI
jgi:hypothetical protein